MFMTTSSFIYMDLYLWGYGEVDTVKELADDTFIATYNSFHLEQPLKTRSFTLFYIKMLLESNI